MKILKKNKKQNNLGFVDRRVNNPQLDAHALAKGLKRRREDRFNDLFYTGLVSVLILVLSIFSIGSFYFN
ncbi:MAG TPA: hypothetical protein DCL21_04800 [Alphaproteobacteria bacterium]|nr:hypothetical protein [Alphaproteobacteria bacterium]